MNGVRMTAAMLALVLETGCPVGGDAGVLHQALLRDEFERVARVGCRPADIRASCEPDDYEACMKECRLEMERRGWK
jgi:hypothetical protein